MSTGAITPQKVADLRADLVERLDNQYIRNLMDHVLVTSRKSGSNVFPPNWNASHVLQDIVFRAKMAELWTATPDMMELILEASRKMPPQLLDREDLSCPTGFLVLPSGQYLSIKSLDGEDIPVAAIMWNEQMLGGRADVPDDGPQRRGVVFNLFLREDFRDLPTEVRMAVPELSYLHVQGAAFGIPSWDLAPSEQAKLKKGQSPKVYNRLHFPHEVLTSEPNSEGAYRIRTWDGAERMVIPDALIQFMSAYWHFVGSTLTEFDHVMPRRSSMRWFQSLNLMSTSQVTVVRLRRRARGQETGRGAALTYRHVRRGHWRMVWVGSDKDGTRRQRATWINPTVVGDDSLPLRQRDVVNIAAR